jgi:lysophosphatidate acyltransferase
VALAGLKVFAGIFTDGEIVLKPIETKNLTSANVEDLTRDTRELMLKEMVALTASQRGRSVPVSAIMKGNGVIKASGAEATLSR